MYSDKGFQMGYIPFFNTHFEFGLICLLFSKPEQSAVVYVLAVCVKGKKIYSLVFAVFYKKMIGTNALSR